MKALLRLTIVIAAITLGMSGAAFEVPCGHGGVSGSVGCQDGSDKNDQVPGGVAGTVNTEIFFGYDDWAKHGYTTSEKNYYISLQKAR